MAKVFLFMSTQCYPHGGMEDCIGSYVTIDEAQQVVNTCVELLKADGGYPGVDELSAQIAMTNLEGDLFTVAEFYSSEWHPNSTAPTLQSRVEREETSVLNLLQDYLRPERIQEREAEYQACLERDARTKEIDKLYKALGKAISTDNDEMARQLRARLHELEK